MANNEIGIRSQAGEKWVREIDRRVKAFCNEPTNPKGILRRRGEPRTLWSGQNLNQYTWTIPDNVPVEGGIVQTQIRIKLEDWLTEKELWRYSPDFKNVPNHMTGYVVGNNPIGPYDERHKGQKWADSFGPGLGPFTGRDYYTRSYMYEGLRELELYLPIAWEKGHDLAKTYFERNPDRRKEI